MAHQSQTDSHGHLDGCCQAEARAQVERARVDKVLARTDPIRRQLQARQIATPWSELSYSPVSEEPNNNVEIAPQDTKETQGDSDFDDDSIMAEFREKRLAELKAVAQTGSQVQRPDAHARPSRLQEMAEDRFSDRIQKAKEVVALFCGNGTKNASADTMKGYLQLLASELQFANVEFWVVSVEPTTDARWSRGGALLKLMIPCLPALLSFRGSRVVNRCVGDFGSVFPAFSDNSNSLRVWLNSQGFATPAKRS